MKWNKWPILLAFVFAIMSHVVSAQTYPSKPIRLVVGFPAGGSSDTVARMLAQKLTSQMGVSVVVDNKPGAGAMIAGLEVARAPADGYTLLYATSSIVLAPAMQKKPAFNPLKDFRPIAAVASAPLMIVVYPQFPAQTVSELIQYAKAHPGTPYAHAGVGTNVHLAAALFNKTYRLNMIGIPYRGAVPALADVVSGQVPTMIFNVVPDALGHVQAGRLRSLAILSTKRLTALPNVPTISEATGQKGLEVGAWHGVIGPVGIPDSIAQKLEREIGIAINSSDFKEKLAAMGTEPFPLDGKDFADYMKAENEKWGGLIKELGIAEN